MADPLAVCDAGRVPRSYKARRPVTAAELCDARLATRVVVARRLREEAAEVVDLNARVRSVARASYYSKINAYLVHDHDPAVLFGVVRLDILPSMCRHRFRRLCVKD
eukprot:SAG11_NODE_5052_length_1678_cov_1.309056_2_plen_107_part_00